MDIISTNDKRNSEGRLRETAGLGSLGIEEGATQLTEIVRLIHEPDHLIILTGGNTLSALGHAEIGHSI